MIGVQSYAAKAAAAVERIRAALARSTAKLAEHERARPAGDDADAQYQWRRDARDLEDRVASDRDALAYAEARAAEARAEEEKRSADAAHAAEERRAAADVRMVRDLDAAIRRVAELRDALSASVARTAGVNKIRGDRAPITDAEARARWVAPIEAITRPAFETRWIDRNGVICAPGMSGAEAVEVQVGVIVERNATPGHMPERFADALVLVDIEGRKI